MKHSELVEFVNAELDKKNIQKMPRTLAGRLDDHASAEFFGLSEKAEKYENACLSFLKSLKSREYKSLPETMKSETIELSALQAKAIIHARRVRELSELRARLAEKESEVESSLGKIPYAQRDEFGKLLVQLQNAIAESA